MIGLVRSRRGGEIFVEGCSRNLHLFTSLIMMMLVLSSCESMTSSSIFIRCAEGRGTNKWYKENGYLPKPDWSRLGVSAKPGHVFGYHQPNWFIKDRYMMQLTKKGEQEKFERQAQQERDDVLRQYGFKTKQDLLEEKIQDENFQTYGQTMNMMREAKFDKMLETRFKKSHEWGEEGLPIALPGDKGVLRDRLGKYVDLEKELKGDNLASVRRTMQWHENPFYKTSLYHHHEQQRRTASTSTTAAESSLFGSFQTTGSSRSTLADVLHAGSLGHSIRKAGRSSTGQLHAILSSPISSQSSSRSRLPHHNTVFVSPGFVLPPITLISLSSVAGVIAGATLVAPLALVVALAVRLRRIK